MAKARTLVGLDVHASKVVAAMLDAETGELRFSRLPGGNEATLALCAALEPPLRAAYEAGPTGFGLARALTAAGIDCIVAAPGKIPRAAQDRVKTDRRDSEHLGRLLLAGKLQAVRVPTGAEEAMRDLVRAREDVRSDLMRARHRVSKMLLRHDQRFSAGQRAWSQGSGHRGRVSSPQDGILVSRSPSNPAWLNVEVGSGEGLRSEAVSRASVRGFGPLGSSQSGRLRAGLFARWVRESVGDDYCSASNAEAASAVAQTASFRS